jgi:hypothetical protein
VVKRLTWFTVGVGVGATGTVVGYLRARELARRHLPESVQEAATRAAGRAEREAWALADRAGDALDDWRHTAADTRRTRRDAEVLLRRQLEQAGL